MKLQTLPDSKVFKKAISAEYRALTDRS